MRGQDTGCAHRRKLTGSWWPRDELIQVDALRAYARKGSGEDCGDSQPVRVPLTFQTPEATDTIPQGMEKAMSVEIVPLIDEDIETQSLDYSE